MGVRLDAEYLLKMCRENKLTPQTLQDFNRQIAISNVGKKQRLSDLTVRLEAIFKRFKRNATAAEEHVFSERMRPLTSTIASSFVQSCVVPFQISSVSVSQVSHKEEYVEQFSINFPESLALGRSSAPPGHKIRFLGQSLEEFTRFYGGEDVAEVIASQADPQKLGKVFSKYMDRICDAVMDYCAGKAGALLSDKMMPALAVSVQQENIFHHVQTHVMLRLCDKLVPDIPSESDMSLHNKMKAHGWIDPKKLSVDGEDMRYGTLDESVRQLRRMDDCRLPEEKLKCIEDAVRVLVCGCCQFLPSKKLKDEPPAADQLDPRFFYAVIKAAPNLMQSSLRYVDVFCQKKRGSNEYCYMMAKKAVMFVEESMNEKTLEMKREEYEDSMRAQQERIDQGVESVIYTSCYQSASGNIKQ